MNEKRKNLSNFAISKNSQTIFGFPYRNDLCEVNELDLTSKIRIIIILKKYEDH